MPRRCHGARSFDTLHHWRDDATWHRLKHDLEGFPDGLRVLELCGGIGTGHVALQELLSDNATFSIVDHFDTDEALRPLLVASGLSSEYIHLGRTEGDIMTRTPHDFALHHVLVAGPPCPPWSSIGSRSSWEDARSKPFDKVLEVIAYHAEHGGLLLFVLENVLGVLLPTKKSKSRPIDFIVKRLRESCPGWSIEVHRVNSLDFGLPQSRPRVYIVGRKYSPEDSGSSMPPLCKFRRRVPLGQCLENTDNSPGKYTPLQHGNIRDWKAHYKFELTKPQFSNQFAVVDASRTPSGRTTWCNSRKQPDICQCLTASGPLLHVFALGTNDSAMSLSLDRPLRNTERAKLQGFSAAIVESAAHMSTADANRIFGNAMTVPVVGAVIGRELVGLHRAVGSAALTTLFSRERAQRRYPGPKNSHRTDVAHRGMSTTRTRDNAFPSPPSLPSSRTNTRSTAAKRHCP